MIPYSPEYAQLDPQCPVDWRWQRACWLVERNLIEDEDEWTSRAVRFLWLTEQAGDNHVQERADALFPDIAAARQIEQSDGPLQSLIEARLLARQTPAQIGHRLNLAVAVVNAYALLFFDAGQRIDCRDYIWAAAIRLHKERDKPAVLRALGYFGGPEIVDVAAPYLLGDDADGLAGDQGLGAAITTLANLLRTETDAPVAMPLIEHLTRTSTMGGPSKPQAVFAGIVDEIAAAVSLAGTTASESAPETPAVTAPQSASRHVA